MVDFGTTTGIYFYVIGLLQLHRESIGVDVNTFLIRRDCQILGCSKRIYTIFGGDSWDFGYMMVQPLYVLRYI